MEMRALGQAPGALSALAELLPDEAERVRGGGTETVAVSALTEGDVVLVRPGGRVPADGELLSDAAELGESMVTGKSRPIERSADRTDDPAWPGRDYDERLDGSRRAERAAPARSGAAPLAGSRLSPCAAASQCPHLASAAAGGSVIK
jgi:magnesium-transporting ATPase (P-type)